MNTSTQDVTLLTQYVLDVFNVVEKMELPSKDMKRLVADIDLGNPFAHIPFEYYVKVCDFVEKEFGEDVIIKVGYQIGQTVYNLFVENHMIWGEPSPTDLMNNLEIAAESTIQDPLERGWETLKTTHESITLRRTQNFNSKLQLGLLKGLTEMSPKVKKESVTVEYTQQIAKGAEFDEYLISWHGIDETVAS